MKYFKHLFLMLVLMNSVSCAIMHHTQVGEIDSEIILKGRKFELVVSETGFNLAEAAEIGKAVTSHQKTQDQIGDVQAIISMFQMGPTTGNHVFSDEYADKIFSMIKKECPSGKVSGLTSVRETAKYPVVSGEIVKIIGFCQRKKG
jgi:hypothetical protein